MGLWWICSGEPDFPDWFCNWPRCAARRCLLLFAVLTHGMLMAMDTAKAGFQATFRVISYSSVTGIFGAIPVVGTLASFWGLYLMTVGIREVNEVRTSKASAAVIVPFVVLTLVAIVVGARTDFSGCVPAVRLTPRKRCHRFQPMKLRQDSLIAREVSPTKSFSAWLSNASKNGAQIMQTNVSSGPVE